jgi:hypothetical protein
MRLKTAATILMLGGGTAKVGARRKPMRWFARALGVGAASLALILATATAAIAYSFNSYVNSPNGGAGQVNGTINFTGQYALAYDGYVQDICPADGLGVSYYFEIAKVGGGVNDLTGYIDWDTDGCGNGFKNRNSTVSRTYKMKGMRVIMCWTDNGSLCAGISFDAFSGWKDNPYT